MFDTFILFVQVLLSIYLLLHLFIDRFILIIIVVWFIIVQIPR